MTQQRLGDAMACRAPGADQIVAATHEVTQTLLLRKTVTVPRKRLA
jgi:hypothetical protein